jgi:3-oxoacyl-(acyl-carrier-protein) synthase/NAD(P)-dependent dehydrogenase (short-subunit alcohol dehydrogenase family)/acyl carrier protein
VTGQADADTGVAVIGMGCRFPGGADGLGRYWDLLIGGGDAISHVPGDRWASGLRYFDGTSLVPGKTQAMRGGFLDDIAGWDAEFFDVPAQEARRIDPQHRLVMEVAWRCLEDAGIGRAEISSARLGVFAGVTDSQQFTRLEHQYDPPCVDDPYMALGSSVSMAAGRLAFFLDATGPAMTVDTACSTSLVALHLARQSLLRHECDLAMVAAASAVIHPESFVAAYQIGMLARDGRCKAFDRSADGFSIGEGAGAILLERTRDATRNQHRIRAIARGSAVNQNGRNDGITAPRRQAQADVIRQALEDGGVTPPEVCFVEAHGAGTALGDAIELEALAEVFGPRGPERPLHVGTVKTNIGHLYVAAGMAGLIKTVLALEHRRIPPNINFESPNPILRRTPWLRPCASAVDLDPAGLPLAGVSSFGWSGTNAHVVLAAAPLLAGTRDGLPPQAFERRKFWPASSGIPANGTEVRSLYCYTRTWRQARTRGAGGQQLPAIVLIAGEEETRTALAKRLSAAGAEVFIHPAGLPVADLAAVLEQAAATRPDGAGVAVVDCSALGVADGDSATAVAAFSGLMSTCQAISRAQTGRSAALLAVVAGVTEVVGGDAACVPAGACLGLMSTLGAEYPSLPARLVDIDPATAAAGLAGLDEVASQILVEAGSLDGVAASAEWPADGSPVAWRNGRRWIPQWTLADVPDVPSPWRADGVYVITGGTRGLGMMLARHIAEAAGTPRLVLAGRSEIPPRSRWDAVISGSVPASEKVRGTIKDVRQLERSGSQVLVLSADVADPAQLRGVLREAGQRFGAVHGIVHCAGVPGSGLLDRKTEAEAAAVIEAKAGALAPLAEAISAGGLDLVVLYSSAVTALGGLGESDYAAANACLEAFAERNSGSGTRVLAVAWGPWRHDDWQPVTLGAAPGLASAAREYRSAFGIADEPGTALLDGLLGLTSPNVLVLTEPIETARQRWAGLRDVDLLTPAPAETGQRRPDLLAAYVPPATSVQVSIAGVWRRYLGLDQVGLDDPFFELGGNSLVGISIVRRLERDFGLTLSPSLLFERPTVRELAAVLDTDSQPDGGLPAPADSRGVRRQLRATAVQARRRELQTQKEAKI